MSAAALRSAALPVLYASSAMTLAVTTVMLRKSSSNPKARPKRPRFNGQIVVYGRNGIQQVHGCLKTLCKAQVIGLSFDYKQDGTICALKLASGNAAVLYPLPEDVESLAKEIKTILQSRQLLKVVFDGVDDVIQLEKRYGIKLENFSDVYLDAVRLNKPDFPCLSELADHCCNVVVEKSSLLDSSMDYTSNTVGLPGIFKAATQAWALATLHKTFKTESAKEELPVYATASQYFTDSALLSRVQRTANMFSNPLQELGSAVARGCVAAGSSPKDRGSGDGGASDGSNPPTNPPSLWETKSTSHDPGPWCGLPIDDGEIFKSVLAELHRHPLAPASLRRRQSLDWNAIWLAQRVRTESLFRLPCGVAIAFATQTVFGGLDPNGSSSPNGQQKAREKLEWSPLADAPSHPGNCTSHPLTERWSDQAYTCGGSHWSEDDDGSSWSEFVKDEIGHVRSKMVEFLTLRDVASLAQPSCHGSVSILAGQQVVRAHSEAQSLRSLQQACLASPPPMPSLQRSLHNLVTEIEAVRRVSPQGCMSPSLPLPNYNDLLHKLPKLTLDPSFLLPKLPSAVPAFDTSCVHTHFQAHYSHVTEHLGNIALSASSVLDRPVRGMLTATSMLAAPV